MSGSDLKLGLTDWKGYALPSFKCSSSYCFDLSDDPNEIKFMKEVAHGIVLVGSYSGSIARWIITKSKILLLGFCFGHTTKVVKIVPCKYPVVNTAALSLSVEGSIRIWALVDGICVSSYRKLLPEGCTDICVSKSDPQLASVVGSFAAIHVVNIFKGQVLHKITPTYFVTRTTFIRVKNQEILVSVTPKGYICIRKSSDWETCVKRVQIIAPDEVVQLTNDSESYIVYAYFSPSMSYTLFTLNKGYVLCSNKKPQTNYVKYDMEFIVDVTWINDHTFVLCEINGKTHAYKVKDPFPKTSFETYINEFLKIQEGSQSVTSSEVITLPGLVSEDLRIKNTDVDSNTKDKQSDKNYLKNLEPLVPYEYITIDDEKKDISLSITSYQDKPVLCSGEHVIVVARDYLEGSLKKCFKGGSDCITANTIHCKDEKILHLIEGYSNGKILVKGVEQNIERQCDHRHTRKVTALLTSEEYLFSGGADCKVKIFSMKKKFSLVKEIDIFSAPIVAFALIPKSACEYARNLLLCIDSNNVICIVDIVKLENKFVFSGHYGLIKNIYVHQISPILLVEAGSLYMWSLSSGHLESIIDGQLKYKYLKNHNNRLIELRSSTKFDESYQIRPIILENLSFNVLVVNVKKFFLRLSKLLYDNKTDSQNDVIRKMSSMPLVMELASKNLWKKLIEGSKYKATGLTFCFVGRDESLSIFSPTITLNDESLWTISSAASADLLASEAMFYFVFTEHKLLKVFNIIETLDCYKENKGFKFPSVLLLIKYLTQYHNAAFDFIMTVLKKIPLVKKQKDVNRLKVFIDSWPPTIKPHYVFLFGTLIVDILEDTDPNLVVYTVEKLLAYSTGESFFEYSRLLMLHKFDCLLAKLSSGGISCEKFLENVASYSIPQIPDALLIRLFGYNKKMFIDYANKAIAPNEDRRSQCIVGTLLEVARSAELPESDVKEILTIVLAGHIHLKDMKPTRILYSDVDKPHIIYPVSEAGILYYVSKKDFCMAFNDNKGTITYMSVDPTNSFLIIIHDFNAVRLFKIKPKSHTEQLVAANCSINEYAKITNIKWTENKTLDLITKKGTETINLSNL